MPFLLHLKYPFFCLDFLEVFLNFHLHVVICACACSVTRLRQLKKNNEANQIYVQQRALKNNQVNIAKLICQK